MMTTGASTGAEAATRELARFSAALRFEDVPPEVIALVKRCVLDGIGACLQGSALPWTRMVQAHVEAEGAREVASVWGSGIRTSWALSALANGTAGHAFEMDDMHKESILHPNSIAVPIALAFAEIEPGTRGRDVLTAIVAGYEVGTRIGNAATQALFLNGFHPQGTSGAFVAAAAAARCLGLDGEATQNALGIAGSLGAGLMAAQEGAMVKRLHSGNAAQNGVRAAQLAQRGFTGIADVVEAPYGGFLSAIARTPNPARLLDGLGRHWETGQVGFKMYPSVTSIHSALDLLKTLMDDHNLKAESIASVEVGVGHMTYVHTAWPYQPAGITAGQMNMFFGLATMALEGRVSAEDFTDAALTDPARLAFMRKINVTEDEGINALGPAARHGCRMRVTTTEGAAFDGEVIHRRASPENPVGADEIEAKFRTSVRGRLSGDAAARVIEHVAHLEQLDHGNELTALLRQGGDA